MKQKHIKSLYATLRAKQSKVNKSGWEFVWLRLEMTNVSSWWRQKWIHKKWRGNSAVLGICPVSSGRRAWGPGTVGMGTSQALQAVGGSKFTIRWSVKSNSFNLCLLHQCPWLCPGDCLVSLSWYSSLRWVKQAAAIKRSFLLPAASLAASCSGQHLLVHVNIYPLLYSNALLPFQMAWWHRRHCSRASSFPEGTGETTISNLYVILTVFWCEGWWGLKIQTPAPRKHQYCSGRCSWALHFFVRLHIPVWGWIIAYQQAALTCWINPTACWLDEFAYSMSSINFSGVTPEKGDAPMCTPVHISSSTAISSLEKGLMTSKSKPSKCLFSMAWSGRPEKI